MQEWLWVQALHLFITLAMEQAVYICWGYQLRAKFLYATSYIPTFGSTVTRNQDVCTNGGSLASINSTEGVLYAEIAALARYVTNNRALYSIKQWK